jgi:hypothetical protein
MESYSMENREKKLVRSAKMVYGLTIEILGHGVLLGVGSLVAYFVFVFF